MKLKAKALQGKATGSPQTAYPQLFPSPRAYRPLSGPYTVDRMVPKLLCSAGISPLTTFSEYQGQAAHHSLGLWAPFDLTIIYMGQWEAAIKL